LGRIVFFIFFLSFVIRPIVAPLDHHSDAVSIINWAKYLWETNDFLFFLGKSVPDAVRANYPPLFLLPYFYMEGFL